MTKQSSIEWLIQCMSIHLTHEQKMQFEGLFQQALNMHKEEIESAYCDGGKGVRDKTYKGMHEYYQETYGGNNE